MLRDKKGNNTGRVLEGERVKQINISETELYITTDKATHRFFVDGDCCSFSYFYEFNNPEQMLTWIMKDIEEMNTGLPDDEETESETIQNYGYRFNTEIGYASVVFRNSSNGYYGGWMTYDGTVDPNSITGIEVKEDWSA